MKIQTIPLALLIALAVLLAQPANAQDYSKIRIVRLSFVEGNVEFQRPGQGWEDAKLNLPIEEGFAIRTADGYAEVEFEDSLTLRMATNAIVEFTELSLENGGRVTRLTIPQGTAIISAKLKRQDAVSIAAPNLNLRLPRSGNFRVDAIPAESWVTVFRGKVAVDPQNGATFLLSGGHTLHVDGNGSGSPEVANNPPQDDFDKWVFHRDEALDVAQNETSSVMGTNSYTEGYADLYNYGLWSDIPGFGLGWMPYGAGVGWMPFMDGQWQFMGGLGWNWMSGEPWGWLPYHFGSWVNVPGRGWAWLPVGTNTWRPATATWVNVNNRLGWIPNAPPLSNKPSKTQMAAIPSTAILAAQGTGGAIKPGAATPVARDGIMLHATLASAPPSFFGALAKQQPQSTTLSDGAATPKSFVQSASASHPWGAGAPASLRGPNAPLTEFSRVSRLSSVPQSLMAPHSQTAPMIARGAGMAGFRGGFGARGGGGGMLNAGPSSSAPATPSISTASSASHSGGSAGSSGGHR